MPETAVAFYRDDNGDVPVLQWLDEIRERDRKAYAKCLDLIERLRLFGHELRRPMADYLRDGIYELRTEKGNVNYRVLYFFHGKNAALLAHGLTKQKKVSAADIDRAVERKKHYEQNPDKHRHEEDLNDG